MTQAIHYSNEPTDKELDSYSLIEVLHERFAHFADHDSDYLELRIKLLLEFFELDADSDNPHSRVFTELLKGYGQFPALRIFPLEDALEVPNTINIEAIGMTYKAYKDQIEDMRNVHFQIQRAYLTNLVLHSIPPRKRAAKIALSELIAKGLPENEPHFDLEDF